MKYTPSDIEKIIYSYLPKEEGYAKPVIEAMNYSFKAGGKRLRPMMMKLCFDMFACDRDDLSLIGPFMAAIEMIHTYSLIHDDLPALDNDDLRRGLPTCHKKYGEDIAILAGDGLLNYAYETATKAFTPDCNLKAVADALRVLTVKPGIAGMIGGQTLDVYKNGASLKEDELSYIYENKTSALIECAMMIGAIIGGAGDDKVDELCKAASAIGLAFQVQDDILDVVGNAALLGKPVLSDEKNDKYTYVTIHGIDAAKEYVRLMSDKANNIIASMPVKNDDAKAALIELVASLIDRDR